MRPHVSRPRTTSGFTLLELVLVLAILAIALLVAAPSLSGFARGRVVDDAAAQFVAYAHFARSQAVSDGTIYRLNFDPAAGRYWLTVDSGDGTFAEPSSGFGPPVTVPEGVRLETDASPVDGAPVIEFDSSARTDPATVRFISDNGKVIEVVCEAPLDEFHVAGPEAVRP
jgi:prepilin-type N-terminal cleavage/methylation domain-containing protein